MKRIPGIIAALVASCALSSCSGSAPGHPAGAPKPAWAYDRESNQGAPVSLALRLDRTEIALSDSISLEQELRVEDGFEADFPEYLAEDFEGFSVVEIQSGKQAADAASAGASGAASSAAPAPDPGAQGGKSQVHVKKKRLTLEPDRSGTLAIAPLAVYFHRAGEKSEQSFLTEEIPITVTGVGSVKDLKLETLRGIYEAPPNARPSHTWIILSAGGAALLAGAVAFFFLRRSERKPPPTVPPHELAYEALRRLVALALVEKGQLELFFVHLSSILREYIERRFLVRAPERTTEEFLQEASKHEALTSHRARLAQFLRLCDEVKFAKLEPDEASIQGAFDVVKQFLAETTSTEAQAA